MSRRKGKSERRIKHWQQLYRSEAAEDVGSKRQKLTPRAVKLPAERLAAPDDLLDLPTREGMVLGLFPGGAIVRCDDQRLLCGIAKTFRAPEGSSPLAVGDKVTVGISPAAQLELPIEDKDRSDGFVLSRRDRRTALSRPQPMSQKRRDIYGSETLEKVIVANMDQLVVVASTRQPPLRHGLIDRFLIIAQRGRMQTVLVVNKIDLARPDDELLREFAELQTRVLLVSATTNEGIDELRKVLTETDSILAGASGVGKSTLINTLVPGAQAATSKVRAKDERGRHTTAASNIYELPAGGIIVDTPGIRELGIHMDVQELPWYFPEFAPFASRCKFNDCTHVHEPECGVMTAVERGEVSHRRYESYLRILETIEQT